MIFNLAKNSVYLFSKNTVLKFPESMSLKKLPYAFSKKTSKSNTVYEGLQNKVMYSYGKQAQGQVFRRFIREIVLTEFNNKYCICTVTNRALQMRRRGSERVQSQERCNVRDLCDRWFITLEVQSRGKQISNNKQ